MKNNLISIIIVALVAGAIGYYLGQSQQPKLAILSTQGSLKSGDKLQPLTKPITPEEEAKFREAFKNESENNAIVPWPTGDDGKTLVRSWYIDLKYIDTIAVELRKLKSGQGANIISRGITLTPVMRWDDKKDTVKKFSIMFKGSYRVDNVAKRFTLRNNVNSGTGLQDTKLGIARVYEWIDPCPNNCSDDDNP